MADSSNVNDVPAKVNVLKLDKIDTIKDALDNNTNLAEEIKMKQNLYENFDVSIAMKNLQNVGSILKVAYAGSKGFKCSISVIKMLSKYQNLIKNSSVALSLFVETCLSALKSLQFTLMLAEMDELDDSKKEMLECASLAGRLIIESEKLITEAGKLCELSEQSLKEATEDFNATKDIQNAFQQSIDKSRDTQKKLKEKQESYVKKINEYIETQKKLTVKADNVREQDNFFNIISIVFLPLTIWFGGSIHGHTASNQLNQQVIEIMNLRKEFEEEEIQVKGEIAEICSFLERSEKIDLDTAIKSIDLAQKALGKITTVFVNTKLFWTYVKIHCEKISDVRQAETSIDKIKKYMNENIKKDFYKNNFIKEIKENGLNWLALGKINNDAKKAIKDVDKNSDSIMSNLPTEQEAIEIMKNAKEILASFPQ